MDSNSCLAGRAFADVGWNLSSASSSREVFLLACRSLLVLNGGVGGVKMGTFREGLYL